MHKIDKSFRETKKRAKRRKQQKRTSAFVRWFGLIFVIMLGLGTFYMFKSGYLTQPPLPDWALSWVWPHGTEEESPDTLAPESEQTVSYQTAIVDLPGDPLILATNDENSESTNKRTTPVPPELAVRVAAPTITFVSDTMLQASQQLIATLPSNQEDFAYFRAHETAEEADRGTTESQLEIDKENAETEPYGGKDTESEPAQTESADPAEDEKAKFDDGWEGGLSDVEGKALFARTAIDNTTSIALIQDEADRAMQFREFVISVLHETSLSDLLTSYHISHFDADLVAGLLVQDMDVSKIDKRYVIAVRGVDQPRRPGILSLMQLSVYEGENFIATLARSDNGSFAKAADPWIKDDLFKHSSPDDEAKPAKSFRLLDAFYSAAIRNGVPSGIVGEAIVMLSRSHDLSTFANADDRMTLVYSSASTDKNALSGRILYIGIERTQQSIKCYPFKYGTSKSYSCSQGTASRAGTAGKASNGEMVTPVDGVLSSPFGPRNHPILHKVKFHAGVDWKAPMGAPVYAAFAGKVAYAGDGQGYGNIIKLTHSGARETRYAHLERFAKGIKPGKSITAGALIGYVGTSGLSTGPHLHFELRDHGQPVDPFSEASGGYGSGDSAVDLLAERIIQVESGGKATAKNQLSTALGLGQFIKPTWLRMMRVYRPELVSSMTQEQLLDLRTDPTISREMIKNLARENESYLRAKGQKITAGHLYLAHFLGSEGANIVLSADPKASLEDLLGQDAINANPFLIGKDVPYLIDWADRKMKHKGKKSFKIKSDVPSSPRQARQYRQYQRAIDAFLQNQY
nr:M23 family metallopeptidase [uncultured Cohaesibacter sp.]